MYLFVWGAWGGEEEATVGKGRTKLGRIRKTRQGKETRVLKSEKK